LDEVVTNWIKHATPEERERAASDLNKLAGVAASIGALSEKNLEGRGKVQSDYVEAGGVEDDFQLIEALAEIELTSRMDSLIGWGSCEYGGWEVVQKHSEYKKIESGFSCLGDADKWKFVDGGDLSGLVPSRMSLLQDENLEARRTTFSQKNGGGLLNICMGIDEIRKSGYGESKAMAEILSKQEVGGFSVLRWGRLDEGVTNWIREATVEQKKIAAKSLNEFVVNAAEFKKSYKVAYVTY
jgi:hypothetical protein